MLNGICVKLSTYIVVTVCTLHNTLPRRCKMRDLSLATLDREHVSRIQLAKHEQIHGTFVIP
jgi:hypothetical protein